MDTPLDGGQPVGISILVGVVGGGVPAQVEAQFFHAVGVALPLETGHAEIEIVANRAMVTSFHTLGARVTGVDELVLVLGVQLVEERLGGEFAAPKAGEL